MARAWPSREQWAAQAEHHVRTVCFAHERVSDDPANWLTPDEQTELGERLGKVVGETRRVLRGRGTEADVRSDRRTISHANRRARSGSADAILHAVADVLRTAGRHLGTDNADLSRLRELAAMVRQRRDRAAAAAEEQAVRSEVARRNSQEGWQAELERRRRIDTHDPLITHAAGGAE
ncbi:hypothetical protein FZ103_00700 [Streptomonospora sp. PA3]|nr:hypothetical protein [Streptomonospora sp. PA3]